MVVMVVGGGGSGLACGSQSEQQKKKKKKKKNVTVPALRPTVKFQQFPTSEWRCSGEEFTEKQRLAATHHRSRRRFSVGNLGALVVAEAKRRRKKKNKRGRL